MCPTIGNWQVVCHRPRLASGHGSSPIRYWSSGGADDGFAHGNRQSSDRFGSVDVGERANSNLSSAISGNLAGRVKGRRRSGHPTSAHWPALSQCPLDRSGHVQWRNWHRGSAFQASAPGPGPWQYSAGGSVDVCGNYFDFDLVYAVSGSGGPQ